MQEKDWNTDAKNLLKAELKRKGITYEQLIQKLSAIGIQDSMAGIKNKLHRGSFSTAFFLQCLTAIGCKEVRIEG